MSIAPWIEVPDGARAVEWYKEALGAEERGHRLEDDAGHVQVAQLAIGDADFWIQEDPDSRGEGSIRMILTVEDPDAALARAMAAGATEVNAVYEGHGWRIGRIADPFGHHWEIGKPLEG
jgi:PhnB protein